MNLSANESLSPETKSKIAALKSWKNNGFYFFGPHLKRVLHRAGKVKTYIFKIIFFNTGPFIIQGSPSEVSEAVDHLPKFLRIPSLTLCFSEKMMQTIRDYNNSKSPTILSFSEIVASIFSLRLQRTDDPDLFWKYKKKLLFPSQLDCLFGFIDRAIKIIVNSNRGLGGINSYYKSLIGEGVKDSTPMSIENYQKDFNSEPDHKNLVLSFLDDYLRDQKKRGFGSMFQRHIYRHFLIWASRLSIWNSSFIVTLPYQFEFFDILEASPRLTLSKEDPSKEDSSKICIFDVSSLKVDVPEIQDQFQSLDFILVEHPLDETLPDSDNEDSFIQSNGGVYTNPEDPRTIDLRANPTLPLPLSRVEPPEKDEDEKGRKNKIRGSNYD